MADEREKQETQNAEKRDKEVALSIITSFKILGIMMTGAQRLLTLAAYLLVLGFMSRTAFLFRVAPSAPLRFAAYPQEYLYWGFAVAVGIWERAAILCLPSLCLAVTIIYLKNKRAGVGRSWSSIWESLVTHSIVNAWFWVALMLTVMTILAFFPELSLPLPVGNESPTSPIMLVFRENVDPSLLHLSISPSNPRSTGPLFLLIEYTDGVLVRDAVTGAVVVVKNDVISGMVSVRSLITPTPTPTPATNGGATAQPTP